MIAGGASLAPSRWSLRGRGDRRAQQPAVLVHGADHGGAEHEELRVLVRGVAGQRAGCPRSALPSEKLTCLPEPLMPGERLLVEQALHAVLLGDALEHRHQQLLVVGGDVGALEHRGDLELPGRDLVVAGLGRDAELEQLALGVDHERRARARGWRRSSGRRTPGPSAAWRRTACGRRCSRSGPGEEEVPVDQEVLLLRRRRTTPPCSGFSWPNSLRTRSACSAIACCERSSGVLWSSASPVIDTNTVGMHSVLPFGFSRM